LRKAISRVVMLTAIGLALRMATGDTIFVLDEFYESPAGVVEHWRAARDTWQDLRLS